MTYGVSKVDIFQTNDLWEKKDMANVTNTLCALARVVSTNHTINNFIYVYINLLCMDFVGEEEP